MTDSWASVDWAAPRPDDRALAAATASLRFRHVPGRTPAVQVLLDHLRATHVNGGAIIVVFDVAGNGAADWFACRNRFEELGLFERLLSSDEARRAVPELFRPAVGRHPRAPTFSEVFAGPYVLAGWLAGVLMSGGAYRAFQGSGKEALELAWRAADEVLDDRYEDCHVYLTQESWSPWFHAVAWDATGILIDRGRKRVTLLALTDAD